VTIPYETSDRGFRYYEPVEATYGEKVSVYESSTAMSPHIWIAIEADDSTAGQQGHLMANLAVETAEVLIATLRQAIDDHYQWRDDESPTLGGTDPA
jgi:hypothetical protein